MLKYRYKTLILLRSSRKEFEKMSVVSTDKCKSATPKRGIFCFMTSVESFTFLSEGMEQKTDLKERLLHFDSGLAGIMK